MTSLWTSLPNPSVWIDKTLTNSTCLAEQGGTGEEKSE